MTSEFVPLIGFDNKYEILNCAPFTIRKSKNQHEVKEHISSNGYVKVNLKQKLYSKHILIAKQFIPNDDPIHKTQVDHINQIPTDNRIENLRWVTCQTNNRNRAIYNGVQSQYIKEIDENSLVVDYYETKTERHEFENYYYHDGMFFYDNDVNYRILNINKSKSGFNYVNMRDKNNKFVSVYIHKFLHQHDM